ncbi:hypothetical protein TWF106_001964 [Orbilia oligospora]|uniref:PCI domain-containing protein n=1 Tax=Orbilia oligospora TaxID=2813651 RepID=A0A6G1MAW0_ORBOL|nr:hypothetical protein TWF788_009091 [Orbilia oligospora]KAF3203412.1 hypothetical protein TWF106_001964 [Orbilia oligospora]KAF3214956.1 hypothetical protein TWF191_009646 [Orbilia oligospora]KAF3216453.1 hypothetical protein TWF679_003068 [Orbilia oligospora]KAF3251060.1 hypothetical protein TWF192_005038 [Orbilia oligospora]
MGSDPQYNKYPDLSIAQHIYQISTPALSAHHDKSASALLETIKSTSAAPLFKYLVGPTDGILTKGSLLKWDEKLYNELQEKNEKELQEWEEKLKDAEEKAGETEVVEAMGGKAEFWTRIGDKEKAVAAYNDVFEKTASLGAKIDIVLATIRVGMFFDDKPLVQKNIEKATQLVESGGDWDRRNRLKTYRAINDLTLRAYNSAAPLLLDSLSTFTSTEICTYETLVMYAVLAGVISLSRRDLKARVIDGAEVLAVFGSRKDSNMADAPAGVMTEIGQQTIDLDLGSFSPLEGLVNNFYEAKYSDYFVNLADVEEQFLRKDRILAPHRRWYVREMRRRGYAQLLESYRTIELQTVANHFGVSVDFVDRDMSSFIPSQGLNCTIDRVNGSIETNRPDTKNKQYQEVIKHGDQLLTKLQKFGQAVRVRGSERV